MLQTYDRDGVDGLELSELSGPLSQFQALKVDEGGMLKMLKAINDTSDTKTEENTIETLVPILWPQLQEKLDAIPEIAEAEKHTRPQPEIMEDLVSQVRGLNRHMRDFGPDMFERKMRFKGGRPYRFHPEMLHEIMMMTHKEVPGSHDYRLLIVAGLIRETVPWISEILVEAHREIKSSSPKQAQLVAQELHRTLKHLTRSHFAKMVMNDSEQSHILMMELPHIIDQILFERPEKAFIEEHHKNNENRTEDG